MHRLKFVDACEYMLVVDEIVEPEAHSTPCAVIVTGTDKEGNAITCINLADGENLIITDYPEDTIEEND